MIKVYSWNVNGIRALVKKGALDQFIDAEKPDILCLQEIKAKEAQFKIDLTGYEQFYYPADKPGYSGVAILTRIKPLEVRRGLPETIVDKYHVRGDIYGDPNLEGRIMAAEFDQFWLVTVYTPNAKDDLSRLTLRHNNWDPAVLDYCKLLQKDKPVVLCGDLNVAHTELDLANPKPNEGKKGFTKEERAGFQAFIDDGFLDTFRLFKKGNGHYTWWSHFAGSRERNIGWRIDYFLVSKELKQNIVTAGIHPNYLGSDHCPTSVILDT